MTGLKHIREQQHLTQEELSERSGISVRIIQRIEAGTPPKGHMLKMDQPLLFAGQYFSGPHYLQIKSAPPAGAFPDQRFASR